MDFQKEQITIKITPAIDSSLFRFKSNAGKINTPRILTVGRLNWIKNYETAIAAVNILIKSGLDVRYEIIRDRSGV